MKFKTSEDLKGLECLTYWQNNEVWLSLVATLLGQYSAYLKRINGYIHGEDSKYVYIYIYIYIYIDR